MNLSRSFFWGTAFSFFGLLLLSEVFLRAAVPSGFWYRVFDPSGEMTSLAELQDRLRFSPRENGDPPLLAFGDSVLGASALMERRLPGARAQTLTRLLRKNLASQGKAFLSLGLDGILLTDIEGLSVESQFLPPREILLLLNFRMFAEDFGGGTKALSRKFLLEDLPPEIRGELVPPGNTNQESRLSDSVYGFLCRNWVLFRETQMLRSLWYYPSRKDFFQKQMERVGGKDEAQEDIMEAALKQKTAPYYKAFLWKKEGLPFACLKRTLRRWAGLGARVTVVLTPQNTRYLGSYLDKPSFRKNRETLAIFFKENASKGTRYEDWSDRYPASLFLDHCHLTPEGNEKYAGELASLLSQGAGK